MSPELAALLAKDPLRLVSVLWPDYVLYNKQREVLMSLWENDETYVPAGHMLGKDFVAGLACLIFFLSRHPCRVVTTSVDYSQLEGVLWGEIRRHIQTCRFPLAHDRGGPLVINHMHIRKLYGGEVCGLSYLTGRVAAKGEGMSGHHIAATGDGVPRTLFVGDEVSGVEQIVFEKASEWANRQLIIGNPYHCDNEFRYAVKGKPGTLYSGGDVPRFNGRGYVKRIIKIRATDSPNVRLAMEEIKRGLEPTGKMLVPGVLPYDKYVFRRKHWDPVKQTVGLDAEFFEGADTLMYPATWLNRAEEIAERLRGRKRQAKAIGIDTAEGGDKTSMAAGDELGILEVVAKRTPDTSVIPGEVIAFGKKWNVPPENWVFDRGGGGKQHADLLRKRGFNCRTVGFGEKVRAEPKRGLTLLQERIANIEERATYLNRRAEMYGTLRTLLDPANVVGYGIPRELTELRSQLAPIPYYTDGEGRLYLPSKNKRHPKDTKPCLIDIIGHSPDEADSVVLMIYGMTHKATKAVAGAIQ